MEIVDRGTDDIMLAAARNGLGALITYHVVLPEIIEVGALDYKYSHEPQ